MSYQSWSVVFGEQPSASKWNILGTNDASFNDGTGIADSAILPRHLLTGTGSTWTYTTYTPTWTTGGTAPSLGNGTLTGSYKQTGKKIHFWVKLLFGSSTTAGTTGWNFSLPVTASSNFSAAVGSGVGKTMIGNWYGENPATVGYGGFVRLTSSTTCTPEYVNSGIPGAMVDVSATAPATWANTWYMLFSGTYEAA